MVQACNPSIWEVEAVGLPKIRASLGYDNELQSTVMLGKNMFLDPIAKSH